jgi:hypothetical protein
LNLEMRQICFPEAKNLPRHHSMMIIRCRPINNWEDCRERW